jgi:tungstate transport system ATP-binding protein
MPQERLQTGEGSDPPEGVLFALHEVVVKRGGNVTLTIDDLQVQRGKILAVIGPNGAGKSTLLLVLNRLLQPESGQILYCGRPIEVEEELAYRRKMALVLQDPLLFDATVFDNVAMGLRFRGLPRDEIKQRVEDWLGRLGVSQLAGRRARKLSGGEAQRINLARALVLQPEVLLLDEPFSALDTPTRTQLLEDFHLLLSGLSLTTIFITHDMDEALYLGDQVAVLLGGRLRQCGSPEEVFNAPADREVAAFVGVETVISGRVLTSKEGMLEVEVPGYKLQAVGEVPPGRQVFVCLRPEDITLHLRDDRGMVTSSARNHLEGTVVRCVPQGGALVRVVVDCGFPVVALVTRLSSQELGLETGAPVMASFKASALHLISH